MRFYDEAIELYQSCLSGVSEHDPEIMLKLARAMFCHGQCREAKDILEALIRENPQFRSTDGHLLYARVLEALELYKDAAREYEILLQSYPGEEARVRFATMLGRLGQSERARVLLEETLAGAAGAEALPAATEGMDRHRQERYLSRTILAIGAGHRGHS